MPPTFATFEEERRHRKERLAAGFRLFSKFGFDEGVAGHITARDPEDPELFWVNPFAVHFGHISVSDLICVKFVGEVVEGNRPVNRPLSPSTPRSMRPVPTSIGRRHSHSIYGKSWSTLGRRLDPITQDACAFYEDHALFDDYTVWSSTPRKASGSAPPSPTTRPSFS